MKSECNLNIETMKDEEVKKELLRIFPDGLLPIKSIIPVRVEHRDGEDWCYLINEHCLTDEQRERLIKLYLEWNRNRGNLITREKLEEYIKRDGWLIKSHGAIASDKRPGMYL